MSFGCLIPVGKEFAESFNAPIDHGLLKIPTLSSFDEALAPWDIIVECNGTEVYSIFDLGLTSEDALELLVYRNGEFVNVMVPGMSEADSECPQAQDTYEEIHVVYYMEDESPWDGSFTRLEAGEGAVTGRLTISGKPAEGVKVSLLLAGKRRTQVGVTSPDGRFEIPIPPGRYFYLGYSLAGPNAPGRHMIAVDRNLDEFGTADVSPAVDGDKIMERFSELASKHGPEEAARMLSEESRSAIANTFAAKYPLNVSPSSAVPIPDIVYMEPVQIVTPLHMSRVSLDRLEFVWTPYERADSYMVRICHVEKTPGSRSYEPIANQRVTEFVEIN